MDAYAQTAQIFKALCDENRVRILERLKNGEKCACNLLADLNVSQPTLSHHMKILCSSGLVDSRKDGKWTYYSISEGGRDNAMRALAELTSVNHGCDHSDCC